MNVVYFHKPAHGHPTRLAYVGLIVGDARCAQKMDIRVAQVDAQRIGGHEVFEISAFLRIDRSDMFNAFEGGDPRAQCGRGLDTNQRE